MIISSWPWKKILMIAGFLILAVFLAVLLYLVFFQPATTPNEPLNNNLNQDELPNTNLNLNAQSNTNSSGLTPSGEITQPQTNTNTAPALVANGGLTEVNQLTENSVISLTSESAKVIYYQATDGKFYTLNANGQPQALSDKIFYSVQKATWSPDRSQAILEYPDGSKIVYNFQTKKQVTLPKHWQDFSWSPSGGQIAAKSLGLDSDNRYIIVSNADGSQAKIIESIGNNADNFIINWSPNQQIIASYSNGLDFDRQKIYFVGLNQENFKGMTVPGRGLQTKWSTAGDLLLYSVYTSTNGYRPELWVASGLPNTMGEARRSLKVNTFADKCAFADNQTLYCAVPTDPVENSGLLPDLLKNIPDKLQKINLGTGLVTEIATLPTNYTINKLIAASDNSAIYFTASNQMGLFSIKLK
ncbi:MAG: hypothetical protein WCW02_03695 [Candidatus Buchananbacteria bacterium]